MAVDACCRLARACVVVLLVVGASGFVIHPSRSGHHHVRHHARHVHHQAAPEATLESVSRGTAQALAVDAVLQALESANLDDAVWGSGANEVDVGVPLFMKMLFRDTEEGTIYSEYNQPVAPAAGSNNKTLASCLQPSRVTVGRGGAMVVEFPRDQVPDDDARAGWWLVLSPQARLDEHVHDAILVVYLADKDDSGVRLVAEHPLPNASFVAVDVTKAMNGGRPRFLVDVRARDAVPAASTGALSAATALEVAGWERGPLLVRALDWGHPGAAQSAADGALRVWQDVPVDISSSSTSHVRTRRRSARRSHRRTTTEMPPPDDSEESRLASEEQQPEEIDESCHLEEWIVPTADLGLDTVVQPKTLAINFCVPGPSLLKDKRTDATTNAAVRMAIRSERGAGTNIPDAQCVPIRYKPITVILNKDGRIDIFTLYDLSAERCGWR